MLNNINKLICTCIYIILTLCFTFLSFSCVTPIDVVRTNQRVYLIQPDGRQRSYILHLPEQYDEQKRYPVIFVFNGAFWDAGNARLTSGFDELVDSRQVICVYPESTVGFPDMYKQWNAFHCCGSAVRKHVDDIGFTKMMLEDLKLRCSVDSDRVYMTGWSNGGMFAFFYAALFPEDVAGVGGIGAAIGSKVSGQDRFWEIPTPREPVPAIIFHGQQDDIVHYDHGYPYALNAEREYLPVRHTVDYWIRGNRCVYQPAKLEKSLLAHQEWQDLSGRTMLAFYSLENFKHNWLSPFFTRWRDKDDPLYNFNAAEVMWDFWQKRDDDIYTRTTAVLDQPDEVQTTATTDARDSDS